MPSCGWLYCADRSALLSELAGHSSNSEQSSTGISATLLNMPSLLLANLPDNASNHELHEWVESRGINTDSIRMIRNLLAGISTALVELREGPIPSKRFRSLMGRECEPRLSSQPLGATLNKGAGHVYSKSSILEPRFHRSRRNCAPARLCEPEKGKIATRRSSLPYRKSPTRHSRDTQTLPVRRNATLASANAARRVWNVIS